MTKKLSFALALVIVTTFAQADPIDWPTLGFSQLVTNTFAAPTTIAHAGDGTQRIFIEEQKGRIWIIQNSNTFSQPFLDISNRVLSAGSEQGLLGLAFPPGYSTNAHFYVDYTRQPDGAVVISRFSVTANPNIANNNSEQVILVVPKAYNNHNGGQIAFGPDGYLYIGVGDGGSELDPDNRGQNPGTLLGKLLRIDVENGLSPYAIPTNNPFVGNTNYAPEIWALGLRNPWRFSFDRSTGDLYIGDVGQNRYEEIDFQRSNSAGGQNYGWRIMEGPTNFTVPGGFTNFSGLTLPITWYDHLSIPTDFGASVIGGYVYRGPSESRMDGLYLFGDFIAGWIWGLKPSGTNWQRFELVHPPNPRNPFMSTFGEDERGRLYLTDYRTGKIFQVGDAHLVWTPVFNPSNGIANSNTVNVTCATPNAVIHYTTNGIDPTESDPVVSPSGIIPITNGATNKARAYRADLLPSAVTTAVFGFKVGTPTFSPPAGPITNNTTVTIGTVTPTAAIYYTTDGSTPTTNSLLYSGPLTLSGNVTLRAFGVANGYTNSSIASAFYSAAQVATPLFTPSAGPITNSTSISISCGTPGAVIFYTLDGSPPSTNSAVYSNPLIVNGGVTLNSFAVANGYLDSAIRSVFFSLVQTATPVFTPPASPVSYGTSVSISCATSNSVIFYTLDGSAPTTNSDIYISPLPVTSDVVLSAFAISPEHLDSDVQAVLFTLLQAATPMFSPSQGPLTNGRMISISCATSNAIIRYTLNGPDPDTNSPVYFGPLVFSGPATLKARAYAPQLDPSDVMSTFFGLLDFKSTVVTTFVGITNSGFANGPRPLARFSSPQGICADQAGNIFVADTGNHVIRKILPSGQVANFAGTGTAGSSLGWATNAQFNGPTGVAVDRFGNVYVADGNNCNRVCKIDTNGMVTVLANLRDSCFYAPGLWLLTTDVAGNVYVGSWASLEKITPTGSVTGLAGTGCNCPGGWGLQVGPGVDSMGNVFSATEGYLWKTAPDTSTDLFAGGNPTFSDGERLIAGFYNLHDATIDDSANILLSDTTRIRIINTNGLVSTLAGTGVSGYQNGRGSIAQFNGTTGLCMDTNGNIYVADTGNNCIRKISPDSANIGIADDWQLTHFGYVGIDPNADPDNDGLSNFAEFWAGTDPLDANSTFAIKSANVSTNSSIQITWQAVPGKTYTVLSSTNLAIWTPLTIPILATNSAASFTYSTSGQAQQRFFRISVNF